MAHWLRFGIASEVVRAVQTSASGECPRSEDSRVPILKELRSTSGRTTEPDWCTTRPDRETHSTFPRVTYWPMAGRFILRRPGCTVTFRRGHQTGRLFILCRVHFRTNWTSGVLRPPAVIQSGSHRKMHA